MVATSVSGEQALDMGKLQLKKSEDNPGALQMEYILDFLHCACVQLYYDIFKLKNNLFQLDVKDATE